MRKPCPSAVASIAATIYRLALLLVAMVIVLLPVVYVAMVGVLGYGLWRFGHGMAPSVVRALQYSLHENNWVWLIFTLPGLRW
jgi:nitrate reductase NapE component